MSYHTKPDQLWRSSVFKYTMLSTSFFFLAALFLLGSVGGLFLYNTSKLDDREQLETFYWLADEIENNDVEWIFDEYDLDQDEFSSDEIWLEHLLGHSYAVYLTTEGKSYGFKQLNEAQNGWSHVDINVLLHDYDGELIEEKQTIAVYKQRINSDLTLTLGSSSSYDYQTILNTLLMGFLWITLTMLPLALVIANTLSRKVYQRLNQLSEQLESIGNNNSSIRLTLSSSGDEFDRVSNNVNDMLNRIEQLYDNIENVSVGIAHDLKTPLTRLSNQLQLMEMDTKDSSKIANHIESAQKQINAMLDTFNSLLRLSEVESGKRKSHFKPIELSSLLNEITDSYAPVFEDKSLVFSSAIVPNLSISGDAELINQLMVNLLENNLRYTQKSGKVWVHLQAVEEGVQLQVGDDGPGIPVSHKDKIFDRFHKVSGSRSERGNGLGLSLVRSIATLHGASIKLLPNQKGTVLNVVFPTN